MRFHPLRLCFIIRESIIHADSNKDNLQLPYKSYIVDELCLCRIYIIVDEKAGGNKKKKYELSRY